MVTVVDLVTAQSMFLVGLSELDEKGTLDVNDL